MMLKVILDKVFYNPYRVIKKDKFAIIGNSFLEKSFSIKYLVPRNTLSFQAGDDCILSQSNIFESGSGFISIGSRTFINAGTQLISRTRIDIGDDVTIAWGCTIYDHDSHSINYRERVHDQKLQLSAIKSGNFIANKNWESVKTGAIKIGNFAWLGFDVVVLKGVTIGEGAIIGARSVVASDIPAWCIAAGNPARVIRQLPEGVRPDENNE